jgi:6,7-dimethyl-8-ribityllumazine synthase
MQVEAGGEAAPVGRVGIVVSEFNQAVTEPLLSGALEALAGEGVAEVMVARVAGSLELAVVAGGLFEAGCEAVVAVGAVIKGETDHYEIVSRESARALTEVGLRWNRPVGNAVLAVHDYEQAAERALPGPTNKGAEAARAAVGAARLLAMLHRG